jgi:membrane fusion protein, multidrug efflux system
MLDDHQQLENQQGSEPVPALVSLGSGGAGGATAGERPRPRRSRMYLAAVAAGLLVLGASAYFAQYWWTTGRYIVSTDDAYVGARSSTLSPKVSGYIAEVAVEDNAHIRASDVVARIDDGDYRLAVQTARDQVAVQQATIDRLGRQITAQEAGVDQAKAQLASAKAAAPAPDLELKRQQELATRQINSRAALEQAQANYRPTR